MGISFGSIGTGLPKDIVKQIMNAERIPLKKMEDRKSKFGDKQKLVEELTSLMNGVKKNLLANGNARSLRELKVNSNEDVVGVSVDKNTANPGSYQFEVMQLAQKSSAMTSGFESRTDSYTGVGFIQYQLPNGDSSEIYVDSESASLDGIAKLINKDSQNGMRASVVNDGSGTEEPWRLLISLAETGDDNVAEFPYFYFVDGVQDLYLEQERGAQDAKVKVDGFEIEVPKNKVTDLIPGVTIDLKKAKPGEEFTLKIGEDTEAITGKINDLVETINGVLGFIKTQNTLDENTDTSRTLGGDLILQTLEGRIRSAVFKDVQTPEGFRRLGDLGITFQRDGTLKLDQKKFDNVLNSNYQQVSQILTGYFPPEGGGKTNGFIDNFVKVVNNSLRYPDGLLSSRKRSLENNMAQVDRRIENRERSLAQKETNLKQKFARLEETISRIKTQGAGVQSLGGQAADPVTQLG